METVEEQRSSTFDKVLRQVSAGLGIIAASALVVLMMATVIDVVVRAISRASVPGMMELAESALVVSVFLGLAWTSIQGGHVAVSIVTDRLNAKAARVVSSLVWMLNATLLIWMTYASFLRAVLATKMNETRFGLVQWPMWPMRWVIAVGLLLWAVVAVVNLVRSVTGKSIYGEEEAVLDV
ncbi:TRAP-type C4-dicarboxylate transport system permease small subunit [Leucobacter exalbidus]|uniref:TRAP-type C4-dicarboxylate transport system permease small subunit n=1 Tax=Leucobacter exalbidus TaxID=662960 RepID=A0A940PKX5_9MICO|nr:TRAP transporter small permease [Leucobacter exalbidus]MBP1325822.1 TRAP-type C4-dicarboxylate transport system permease small subunit [Leucobacter exalbidus]